MSILFGPQNVLPSPHASPPYNLNVTYLNKLILVCVLSLFIIFPNVSVAVQPDEIMADPVEEARAREISKGLRCVVCRNQSIDDSNAGLARDLRILLRERLRAGDTNKEAVQYMVDRYGPYILLKPRLQLSTYLLWFSPVIMIVLAVAGFSIWWRKSRSNLSIIDELNSEDRALLESILASKEKS